MRHLDLFSGIGGFALAAQTVWGSDYHCVGFVEIDHFCQQVLAKNFPGVQIYGDIRGLTAERLAADAANMHGDGSDSNGTSGSQSGPLSQSGNGRGATTIDLLTGGFPCQPFSQAGKRRGGADDRYLWPAMLRIISETRPHWVIGENVPGIINMALDQVCADMENVGYEVQPLVIPACAVNAPHKRDRVWIVGHLADSESKCGGGKPDGISGKSRGNGSADASVPSPDPESPGREGRESEGNICPGGRDPEYAFPNWNRDWRDVAFESCIYRVDDGLPKRMVRLPDGTNIKESKWRREALKCYGNSIVPEVAMEIMRGIRDMEAAA